MIVIIYMIYNNIDNCAYIGSTSQTLKIRYSKHKSRAKTYKNKFYAHCDFIGWDNIKIKSLALINADSWQLAHKIEQCFIDTIKPKLNTNRAIKKIDQ